MAKVPNGVEKLPITRREKIRILKIQYGGRSPFWKPLKRTRVTDRRQTDGRQHIANVNRLDKFWSDQELSVIIDYDAELHGVGNRSIILQYYVYAYYIRYFRVISRIQKPLRLYFRFHVRYMLSPVRLSSVCLSSVCL